MNKKNCSSVRRPAYTRLAFTLVELIVVITILAILWTIAFISLQWYSSQARDSKRLSDISNIKKSLELFSLNTWKYPIPDDNFTVSYSWEILRYQWIVWEQVSTNLSRNLNEKPLDPLTEVEYTYSTTHSQTDYEVLGLYESDLISTSPQPSPLRGEGARTLFFSSSNAETQDYPKIDWNYNWIYLKTSSFYIPTPSIINAEIVANDDLDSDNIKSQIISWGDNLPWISTWWLDVKLSVFTWTLYSDSLNIEKISVINSIQWAYIWTKLANIWIYSDLLTAESDEEKLDLSDYLLLNGVGNNPIICWEDKYRINWTCSQVSSCSDIKYVFPWSADGIYTIYPENNWVWIDVYCDMTKDWWGWTLVLAHNWRGNPVVVFADNDTAPTLTTEGYIKTENIDFTKYRVTWHYDNLPSSDYISRIYDISNQEASVWETFTTSFKSKNNFVWAQSEFATFWEDNTCTRQTGVWGVFSSNTSHIWILDHVIGCTTCGSIFVWPSYNVWCRSSRWVLSYPNQAVRIWLK